MSFKPSPFRIVLYIALGLGLFVWGYGEYSAGTARGGRIQGADAHTIGILKMIGGVAMLFVTGWLVWSSRKAQP
jgi:hypothetical protein